MGWTRLTGAAAALALGTAPAGADVEISFDEAAPRDRFYVTNASECDLARFDLVIDLESSAGRLYFDTTPQGAGVSVSQPFLIAEGPEFATGVTPVGDGDTSVRIAFAKLPKGARVVFTADLDDRLASGPLGQTMIAGSEIAGALVRVSEPAAGPNGALREGAFDTASTARVAAPGCERLG